MHKGKFFHVLSFCHVTSQAAQMSVFTEASSKVFGVVARMLSDEKFDRSVMPTLETKSEYR